MEAAIHFENVSKRFTLHHEAEPTLKQAFINAVSKKIQLEEFWAIRNLSFTIHPGEVVGIIGKNGSGKSTLLRLIAGIMNPDYGRIKLRGRVASFLDIGAGFHADFNGRENIYLYGTILGMTTEQIEAAYDQIVEFSGLGSFIDVPIRNYSSGMGARLGFSVAANLNPDILLIDEVLSVGDFVFQRKCFNKLEEFKNSGKTIVMVSHSLSDVEELCTRAICLHKGQILMDADVPTAIETYLERTREEDEWKREILRRDEIMAARHREEQEREKARREREQFLLRIRAMEIEQEQRRKDDQLRWQLENEKRIAEENALHADILKKRDELTKACLTYEQSLAYIKEEYSQKVQALHEEYKRRNKELDAHYEALKIKHCEEHRLAKMQAGADLYSKEWLGKMNRIGRWGDRRLEITDVAFLNRTGDRIDSVISGEPLTMSIAMTVHESIENPVLRIMIFRDNGMFIYGMSTARIRWKTGPLIGSVSLRVSFPTTLLLKGTYQFSIGAWPDAEVSFWEDRPYDVHNFIYSLTVDDDGCFGGGTLYLPSTWELTTSAGLQLIHVFQ